MDYLVYIRQEAESDIKEAFNYYQRCNPSLGGDFLLCVDEAISKITRNPLHYSKTHKDFRRVLIHRFPFGVFYKIIDSNIVVFAVMHSHRNPKAWKIRR